MKKILTLIAILAAGAVYAQKMVDTSTSKTKIYSLLNSRNSFLRLDRYELKGETKIKFSPLVIKNVETGAKEKGAGMIIGQSAWTGSAGVTEYLDFVEISEIVVCLKYIIDNINLEEKPDHDVSVYYTTVDGFEIGAKATKGNKYKIYFYKRIHALRSDEYVMSRKDLDDIYSDFNKAKLFIQGL